MDLDHLTGEAIGGWQHVVQSIETLLSTRIDTRVFRREFGSRVPEHIDAPMNDQTVLSLYVAAAEAIEIWEPRFEPRSVVLEAGPDGHAQLRLDGVYLPRGHLGDTSVATDGERAIRLTAASDGSWRNAA